MLCSSTGIAVLADTCILPFILSGDIGVHIIFEGVLYSKFYGNLVFFTCLLLHDMNVSHCCTCVYSVLLVLQSFDTVSWHLCSNSLCPGLLEEHVATAACHSAACP